MIYQEAIFDLDSRNPEPDEGCGPSYENNSSNMAAS